MAKAVARSTFDEGSGGDGNGGNSFASVLGDRNGGEISNGGSRALAADEDTDDEAKDAEEAAVGDEDSDSDADADVARLSMHDVPARDMSGNSLHAHGGVKRDKVPDNVIMAPARANSLLDTHARRKGLSSAAERLHSWKESVKKSANDGASAGAKEASAGLWDKGSADAG